MYEDIAPAEGALISITSVASGNEVALAKADRDGRFEAVLEPGEYALAVTTERGFSYVETTRVPELDAKVTLSRACRPVRGRANGALAGTQVSLARKSKFTGDVFIGDVRADGSFTLCLPEGHYSAELRGPVVSMYGTLDLTATAAAEATLELEGFAADRIKQPPGTMVQVAADLDGLVADIIQRDPRVIGLGEATHGTAELVTSRSTLTFELIRRADVRLVLFEVDAVLMTALDDYVMGGDVDVAKSVAALGFWITDTFELLRFFQDLRAYNAKARTKVRVGGVDVQNTQAPVALLLANAKALKLTADDKALLDAVAEKRAAPVRKLAPPRRAALDALLARLSKPRGTSQTDQRIELAARSLIIQIGYLDGDAGGLYGSRRDAGMASIASFLVAKTAAPRACVWAHAGHIAREPDGGVSTMGQHLAADAANRYYAVGFYMYEGSVRAWDAAGEIGVISHRLSAAPSYTLEGAVMAATGAPDIAWLPMTKYPPALRTWMETPRYVREVGASFSDETQTMALRNLRTAFDAVVVIKLGHDSSPTPTGVRKVASE